MHSRIQGFLINSDYRIIGISGGSGAGKTTLTKALSRCDGFCAYSLDYRLIGGHQYRSDLLDFKAAKSVESYVDMCNDSNWWDWDTVIKDMRGYLETGRIRIEDAYNRDTGLMEPIEIAGGKLLVDSAIFGTPEIMELLDIIVFVYRKPEDRLRDTIKKDLGRRSLHDILARFFMTEYSESLHYRHLLDCHRNKLVVMNDNYEIIDLKDDLFAPKASYLPIRMA